ncbi:hypothetical protein COT64_03240 [Candidatus Shapirobacteria bacterium CG09_land_8_20_14_0_10_39_12]|uniref:Polysaccharide biosynthesis protein C-terminal domain-containing protein n=1 Tax=Candidatus Shapirobacteria bacterium CG09_land_8_20_14_0_10_39_12 TaxID=1974885 RepID=A0A2H0WNU3_9BACT|nr:MAG: hypothetical protein COT64_03240 [Candidatus Shapirobacteria bacterium CG09_land_8_20_14_0_10_39_12]
MGYLKQTIKGLSWVGAFRISSRFVSFLRTIVLARILLPAQFGVFGIISLVLSFLAILTEVGVTFVLVKEENLDDDYINTAWLISLFRGLFSSLIIILSAKSITRFFHTPEIYSFLILASLIPLIRGLINPAVAKFQKELLFKKEFNLKFSVFAIDSLVAIVLTFLTRSAVSLVWGLIAGSILEVILSFTLARPLPKFSFNVVRFNKIIGEGKWITALGISNFFFGQGDNLVVGKLLGSGPLGVYQMAYKLAILPITELADIVARVTFPVYSKIARNPGRIKKAFRKTALGIAFPAVLLGLIFFLFPKSIVKILLGSNWLGVIPVLRVLAVFGTIKALLSPSLTLLLSLGKQKCVTLVTFWSFCFLALMIFPLMSKFGIIGAAYAVLIATLLEVPIVFLYLNRSFEQKKL